MRTKVIVLRGLPASGKSTWAKDFVDRNPGWMRINKDDMRAMLHNGKWSKDNERQVLLLRDASIEMALTSGYSVVVDDTNFASSHITAIQTIADLAEADFEVKDFDVPPAIVCDLDGTLALHTARGPFELGKVYTDNVNAPVLACIREMQRRGYKIIFASGREDSCRDETVRWLKDKCDMTSVVLYMRKTGDNRKDSLVKEEIYKNDILPEYYVSFVLDDRQQVVDALRELGLTVFQVAPGKF